MNDIIWLIRKTLKTTFKNKKNLLLYVGLPLIGIFISTLIYGHSGEMNLNIGIVNKDGSQIITQDTIRFVKSLKHVKISEMDQSELTDQISSGKLDCAIIFDHGFAQGIRDGKPGNVQIVSIKGAQITGYVKSLLYNYIDNVTAISKVAAGDQAKFDKMYSGDQNANFTVSTETLNDNSTNKNMTHQTIGYLVMFMMFSAVNLSGMILKERENRTFYRLLSTPITSRSYVVSNVIVNIIVMMLQIVVTLLFMKLLFHIDPGIPVWQMFCVLLLFGLVAISISLAIVALSRNSTIAGALQNLFITPTCLLAGCFFPIEIMPDMIRKISDFMPQHWLLDTIDRLQQGNSFESLYLNLMILFAFALTFSLIAIYRFGRNNDTRTFI